MTHLLVNYYKSLNNIRNDEIDYCFNKNYNNQFIDKIHVFSINNVFNIKDPLHKIEHVSIDRPTYKMYFEYANNCIPDNDIIILANSDIYFDETINLAINIKKTDLYALTRYDSNGDGNVINEDGSISIYSNSNCSQDVWIYRNYMSNLNKMSADFTLGILGCDNRIAFELIQSEYNIENPSLSIKCYHFHNSLYRMNNERDRLRGNYAFINKSHYLK